MSLQIDESTDAQLHLPHPDKQSIYVFKRLFDCLTSTSGEICISSILYSLWATYFRETHIVWSEYAWRIWHGE